MAEMTEEAAKALRADFEPGSIGKLPRVTCKDCSDKNTNCTKHQRSKCTVCGNYISTAHIHLDYVGHAAVTDRLLQVDPEWSWEPVAFDVEGAPLIKRDGKEARLWVRLTICGVTRLGVGSAKADSFELDKQLIGDAIRNAAMRFGVALSLWSKEDLHQDEPSAPEPSPPAGVDATTGEVAMLDIGTIETMKPRELMQALAVHDLEAGGTVAEMRARLVAYVIAMAGGEPALPPEPSPPAGEPHGYDVWTREELSNECKRLQLPHSGSKERMIDELRAWNALNAPDAPEYDEPQFL